MLDLHEGILTLFAETQQWASVEQWLDGMPIKVDDSGEFIEGESL